MPLTVCVLVAFVFLCPHFMSVSCVFVVLFCFLNIAEHSSRSGRWPKLSPSYDRKLVSTFRNNLGTTKAQAYHDLETETPASLSISQIQCKSQFYITMGWESANHERSPAPKTFKLVLNLQSPIWTYPWMLHEYVPKLQTLLKSQVHAGNNK